MKKLITMSAIAVLMVTGAVAQGHGRGQAANSPGAAHSNAPAGTPAASRDRDHGKQRAQDVGRGKKKGLKKHHKSFKERLGFKKHNKTQAKNHNQHRSQSRGRN